MNQKWTALALAGAMVVTVSGCDTAMGKTENTGNPAESSGTTAEVVYSTPDPTEDIGGETGEETAFSFRDLSNLEFYYSSGAGGWGTQLVVQEDGSFTGNFQDSDMGNTAPEYPNGTVYLNSFSGKFSEPEAVNAYTYSTTIQLLEYEEPVHTDKISGGIRYDYSEAYGLQNVQTVLIYLPEAPLEELPEEFLSWVGYPDLSKTEATQLGFYALNCQPEENGFISFNLLDSLRSRIASTKEQSEALETAIQQDSLTQTEYNEKTQELYELWDAAMNAVWTMLEQTLDNDTMDKLTMEQRQWTIERDNAVEAAGADYEGGTTQAMVQNQTAAEWTKARVDVLLNLLPGWTE